MCENILGNILNSAILNKCTERKLVKILKDQKINYLEKIFYRKKHYAWKIYLKIPMSNFR